MDQSIPGGAWLEENGGNCDLRLFRGGSWYFEQLNARSAERSDEQTDYRGFDIGLRVVCASPIN